MATWEVTTKPDTNFTSRSWQNRDANLVRLELIVWQSVLVGLALKQRLARWVKQWPWSLLWRHAWDNILMCSFASQSLAAATTMPAALLHRT